MKSRQHQVSFPTVALHTVLDVIGSAACYPVVVALVFVFLVAVGVSRVEAQSSEYPKHVEMPQVPQSAAEYQKKYVGSIRVTTQGTDNYTTESACRGSIGIAFDGRL